MTGRVDSLRRITIIDERNDIAMRCSRLICRFLREKDVRFLYDGEVCRVQFCRTDIEMN